MDVFSPSQAVSSAWTSLVRAQRMALDAIENDLKRASLPPLAVYDALLELRRAGPAGLRPRDLQARLLLAQPNVSRLIDRLENAGYATRQTCPHDARGWQIALTDVGASLLTAMWPVYAASIDRHIGRKLEDETAATTLADLLSRIAQR